MLDKLAGIEARFAEITQLLADPEIATDYTRVTAVSYTHLTLPTKA